MTESVDDQYNEAMEHFGGKIPKIGEPVEYIVTDRDMTNRLDAAYVQNLIDKYGEGITSTVTDDMDDFGPAPDYSEFDPEFYGHDPE